MVRAFEGCLEAPLQLLYKLFLMSNGITEFDLTKTFNLVFRDLHGNSIPIPYFLNMTISAFTLIKAVFSLNLYCFDSNTFEWSDRLQLVMKMFPFLVISTIFKMGSLIVLTGCLNTYSIFPIMVVFFIGIFINQKTLQDSEAEEFQRYIPRWLIVFMNVFVPLCFTTKVNREAFKVLAKNLKYQAWNCFGIYVIALIAVWILINLNRLAMFEDIPYNNMHFNITIIALVMSGVSSVGFSFYIEKVQFDKVKLKVNSYLF